jgi:hypothetical protein
VAYLLKVACSSLAGLILFFSTVPPQEAEGASLRDIVVANTRDHLLLYFYVEDCFTPDVIKAIENGITTTFTFYVKLYEVKRFWWDREVADLKLYHSIYFDNLKRNYTVTTPENNQQVITSDDFDDAQKMMSSVVGLKVTDLQNLQKGRRYQIRMMAELDKIKLPLYLHHVLFFLSLWDFKTDWYTFDFRY